MLHILLFILKIIGIVLLCIFGILLLAVVCALFVPVRYRIEAVREEGEGEPPVVVTVKVTWLLHFVNVLVRFAGSLSVRARLMVFTVFRLPKREKPGGRTKPVRTGSGKDKEKKKRLETVAERPEGKSAGETKAEEQESEEKGEETRNAEEKRNTEETQTVRETGTVDGTEGASECIAQDEDKESAVSPGKKPTFWDKLRAIPKTLRKIFAKIKSILENIQYTIQNICDKIKSVSDTIEYYKGVIEGEPFQRSFALCKGEFMTILKRLKPDRFEVSLIVGMDDPAATGEILAVCGMLYPIFGPQVNVAGDFERKRLEGRVFIKGKLRFFTFVRTAVRIYFNKDIRKLYGLLKKEAV